MNFVLKQVLKDISKFYFCAVAPPTRLHLETRDLVIVEVDVFKGYFLFCYPCYGNCYMKAFSSREFSLCINRRQAFPDKKTFSSIQKSSLA